jgi:transposase
MSNINATGSSAFPESKKGMHYETHCGALIKVLWHDGQGMCLFAKRLERGRFVWPTTAPRDDADRTVSSTMLIRKLGSPTCWHAWQIIRRAASTMLLPWRWKAERAMLTA